MNTSYSITSKFQVTIPKLAREKLGLKAKDKVRFEIRQGQLVVERQPSLKEVSEMIATDIKRQGIKPATQEEINNARDTFYKEGLKWE